MSERSELIADLRFCCAANVVTSSEAREPDAYRDSSNRWLGSVRRAPRDATFQREPHRLAPISIPDVAMELPSPGLVLPDDDVLALVRDLAICGAERVSADLYRRVTMVF